MSSATMAPLNHLVHTGLGQIRHLKRILMEVWEETERVEKTLDDAVDALAKIEKGMKVTDETKWESGELKEGNSEREEKRDKLLGLDLSGEPAVAEVFGCAYRSAFFRANQEGKALPSSTFFRLMLKTSKDLIALFKMFQYCCPRVSRANPKNSGRLCNVAPEPRDLLLAYTAHSEVWGILQLVSSYDDEMKRGGRGPTQVLLHMGTTPNFVMLGCRPVDEQFSPTPPFAPQRAPKLQNSITPPAAIASNAGGQLSRFPVARTNGRLCLSLVSATVKRQTAAPRLEARLQRDRACQHIAGASLRPKFHPRQVTLDLCQCSFLLAYYYHLHAACPTALRLPSLLRAHDCSTPRSSRPILAWSRNHAAVGKLEREHEEGASRAMMATCTAPNGARTWRACRQRELPALQPTRPPPKSRRKRRANSLSHCMSTFVLFVILAVLPVADAVFINFDNCLERSYQRATNPVRLQYTPYFVWAQFNNTDPAHGLNLTIYGNVSGQLTDRPYPPPSDPVWTNPKEAFGKIPNAWRVGEEGNLGGVATTLFPTVNALTYSSWDPGAVSFCDYTINKECPLAPVFPEVVPEGTNLSDPTTYPAFGIRRNFYSSYSFTTWEATFRIVAGDKAATTIGCISATITPDLGSKLRGALRYLPAAVLILVAVATVFAAMFSPWGTTNIFRWSSNYGRDEDLLRLVTPGFGDCLQYIQFVVLAGSLNLQYPGYFQPVISQASWSTLMFNQSFVSGGNGTQSLVDGIYFVNGTYGLSRLGKFVGISEDQDVWAGMAIWLLVMIGIVVLLIQLGFLLRWVSRHLTNVQDTDLRGKNWPFTVGNVVRITLNWFMLPIITLSFFQMVVAPDSSASVVACAVILLIIVGGAAIWIFWMIFTTRPRAHLFDDLRTVLTYGPLYNTYSDDAAPFAFIPALLTIIRGVAIGAIQPSGIAQVIILAICEVILIMTLHAFRPFQSNTSMNAYHTFFAAVRLACVLLMIAFVPSLGVGEASKGWIGYAILLLHAVVLVFGFFLNSLQTIIEVAARLTGAGADQRGGLTKVFGSIQLSGRARSLSGSSAVLLNGPYGSNRESAAFDGFSQGEYSHGGGTSPGTPGTNATPFNFLGGSSSNSRRPTMGAVLDNPDPYYRPPRPRKHTMDSMTANMQSGRSQNADLTNAPYADNVDLESGDLGEGPSTWSPGKRSITPAFLRMQRDDSDPNIEHHNNTDYSVRESDFYYGLRGPALSAQPTRKLKTGPADPMGPVSSATGWFKSLGLFAGKKKEKGKGFEVVRSTRMPPQMMIAEEDEDSPHMPEESYHDSPGSPASKKKSFQQDSPGAAAGAVTRASVSESDTSSDEEDEFDDVPTTRVSDLAPTLGPIDTGGGIELPSRIGSRASRVSRSQPPSRAPTIPRKSSRRTPSTEKAILDTSNRLSSVMATPPGTPARPSAHIPGESSHRLRPTQNTLPIRLPFGSSEPSPSPDPSPNHSATSSLYPNDTHSNYNALETADALAPPRSIQTGEQPLSTGYVHQHVARDSIQNDGYMPGSHLETSAEIVDRSRSVSSHGSMMNPQR
ncbi:hypothetical protein BU23DRAFT_595438 [Bimuria novae-zelandiae CBS 107.79]|uniref:ML-like domain-containing protein n=1 Tax=Bimuria novae-zelandiae CBS 107.79 TaxID=1447943 RepID=A0A6A5W0L4_9PLEO|nr:hypothetical protein BU23DRAFT_595438 [Bimuria novae-zelandiae CBS 107.79]